MFSSLDPVPGAGSCGVAAAGYSLRPWASGRHYGGIVFAEELPHLCSYRVSVRPTYDLCVDRESGTRVKVSDLVLDVRKVEAGGKHDRDERPPERVRRHVGADRRLVALCAQRVGVPDDGREDPCVGGASVQARPALLCAGYFRSAGKEASAAGAPPVMLLVNSAVSLSAARVLARSRTQKFKFGHDQRELHYRIALQSERLAGSGARTAQIRPEQQPPSPCSGLMLPLFGCRFGVVRADGAGERCRILADRKSGAGRRWRLFHLLKCGIACVRLLAEHDLGGVGSRTSRGREGHRRDRGLGCFPVVHRGSGLAVWVCVVVVSGCSLQPRGRACTRASS